MVDHLPSVYRRDDGSRVHHQEPDDLRAADGLASPPWLRPSKLVKLCFDENPLFTPDNTFRQGGHMHGNLRTLVGAADYALYVKDPVLFSRVDALYRYVRSTGTRFGFLPEVIGRKGDVVSCETCALMDFIGLAVTLANNGHPEYWGDVERMVRNQLVESQVVDGSWLKPGTKPDSGQFTWRDVGARMVGGYAGWSSPTHILAAQRGPALGRPGTARQDAGLPELLRRLGHARLLHRLEERLALRQRHALRPSAHRQAPARGRNPLLSAVQGPVDDRAAAACKVRVRIPEFVAPDEIKARSSAGPLQAKVWGNYLELGDHKAGEKLEVTYPLPLHEEAVTIGNPGFRQYHYRVTWKGDTVVRMTPVGEPPKTAYSDFDRKQVEVFYGTEGPGPLYQREYMLEPADPQPAPLHMDDGSLDFWWLH